MTSYDIVADILNNIMNFCHSVHDMTHTDLAMAAFKTTWLCYVIPIQFQENSNDIPTLEWHSISDVSCLYQFILTAITFQI